MVDQVEDFEKRTSFPDGSVGTVLSSQNSLGSWFGESDDRYYVDGEEQPRISLPPGIK